MKRLWLLMMLAGAFAIALPARAVLLNFHVNLSGANEVPPTGSPATGFADLTLDTVTNDLTGHIEFSGLLATTTAAHIHCCLPSPFLTGVNVGVATLVPAFPGFPLGVTSGADNFVLDLDLAASYNPAFITAQGDLATARASFIAALESDRTYLNIHTAAPNGFPGGEIRGFVVIPEPPLGSLILVAFALVGFARARPRRARGG
jgi:hypothetical protein